MPVVVEIEVAGIVARAAKAGVDVETAMRPRRDTGRTSGKTHAEGVERGGCRQAITACFFRSGPLVRLHRHAALLMMAKAGRFFLLTGELRNRNVISLIKTGGGIGPLMPGQPSGSARTVPTPAGRVSTFRER
jgi:hypothetical protein